MTLLYWTVLVSAMPQDTYPTRRGTQLITDHPPMGFPILSFLFGDTWHITHDTWYLTHDRWGVVNLLLWFGRRGFLKIWKKRLTHLINYKAVCRTARLHRVCSQHRISKAHENWEWCSVSIILCRWPITADSMQVANYSWLHPCRQIQLFPLQTQTNSHILLCFFIVALVWA